MAPTVAPVPTVAPTPAPTVAPTVAPVPTVAAVPTGVSDAGVAAANAGLAAYLAADAAGTTTVGVCPILSSDRLGQLAQAQGLGYDPAGVSTGTYLHTELNLQVVECGSPVADVMDTVVAAPQMLLDAVTLDATHTFQNVLDQVPGLTPAPVTDPAIGGEMSGVCLASTNTICYQAWHRGNLVLGLYIVAPLNTITDAQAQALLLSLVPEAVANLAAGATTA